VSNFYYLRFSVNAMIFPEETNRGGIVMSKKLCTEIAEFEVVPGIKDEEFINIVEQLEVEFHSKQKGFVDTELAKVNDSNMWVMLQHWESTEESREASKNMMKTPITKDFREALDPKTVRIKYLNHMRRWNK